MDLSSSANNEGVLQEDLDRENADRQIAINKDERNKLIKRGDLPETVTLDQYTKAKEKADVGNRITSWWSGKINDDEVERIIQVLSKGSTTNQGDIISNTSSTDLSSVTNTSGTKLEKANEMSNSALEKDMQTLGTGTSMTVNNANNINNLGDNVTTYQSGNSSIGTKDSNKTTENLHVIP